MQNLIGDITLSSVITPVAAVNCMMHQTQQKVQKCSLALALQNGIVTFYENCTNKYGRVNKLGGCVHPPGYTWYLRYNVLMAWAIRTIYTSKCVQMDLNSYLKRQNFSPYATSVTCKNRRGGYHLLGSLRVKMSTSPKQCDINSLVACFNRYLLL